MKTLLKILFLVGVTYYVVTNKPSQTNWLNKNNEDNSEFSELKKVVYEVRGLGNVDYSTLKSVSETIENFYGFTTIIKTNVNISQDMFIKNTEHILNASICLRELDNHNIKVIFVTDKELWASGDFINGLAYYNGDKVIVSTKSRNLDEVVKHEVGHTFGLEHCNQKTCVMASANDQFETGKFCENCRNHFVIRFDLKQ